MRRRNKNPRNTRGMSFVPLSHFDPGEISWANLLLDPISRFSYTCLRYGSVNAAAHLETKLTHGE
jgi:hypothetical protein